MISLAIQAGGTSQRMGRDKALVQLDGLPLIEHVLNQVRELSDDLFITSHNPDVYKYLGVRLVKDTSSETGALIGLHSAIQSALYDLVLVVACDMPFLCPSLLKLMIKRAVNVDVVIPKWKGNYEPLHAVYSKGCLPAIECALKRGEKRIISFYPDIRLREIAEHEIRQFDSQGLTFYNVNTRGELKIAEAHIKRVE